MIYFYNVFSIHPKPNLGPHIVSASNFVGSAWQELSAGDTGKYPLPSAPAYMEEIHKEIGDMEPPEFATQGEAVGKCRGRKAKAKAAPKAKGKTQQRPRGRPATRVKASAKSRAKATKPRGARTKSMAACKSKAACKRKAAAPKRNAKRKSDAVPEGDAMPASSNAAALVPAPEPIEAKPKRKPRVSKPPPADSNEERVPPPHVTHNHIYSSAYRKALASKPGDPVFARNQGSAAVEHFKRNGTVNGLCGVFRSF